MWYLVTTKSKKERLLETPHYGVIFPPSFPYTMKVTKIFILAIVVLLCSFVQTEAATREGGRRRRHVRQRQTREFLRLFHSYFSICLCTALKSNGLNFG